MLPGSAGAQAPAGLVGDRRSDPQARRRVQLEAVAVAQGRHVAPVEGGGGDVQGRRDEGGLRHGQGLLCRDRPGPALFGVGSRQGQGDRAGPGAPAQGRAAGWGEAGARVAEGAARAQPRPALVGDRRRDPQALGGVQVHPVAVAQRRQPRAVQGSLGDGQGRREEGLLRHVQGLAGRDLLLLPRLHVGAGQGQRDRRRPGGPAQSGAVFRGGPGARVIIGSVAAQARAALVGDGGGDPQALGGVQRHAAAVAQGRHVAPVERGPGNAQARGDEGLRGFLRLRGIGRRGALRDGLRRFGDGLRRRLRGKGLGLRGDHDALRGDRRLLRGPGGGDEEQTDDRHHRGGRGPEAALEIVDPHGPFCRAEPRAAQGHAAVVSDAADLLVGLRHLGVSVVYLIHSPIPPPFSASRRFRSASGVFALLQAYSFLYSVIIAQRA